MHPEQIALVQRTFTAIQPIADTAATLFYERLFVLDPSLRKLFKGDLTTQGHQLMQALSIVVHGLDRLDTILPAIQNLGRRHGDYGIQDMHYDTVGAALLWTLEHSLGAAFTPMVRKAWATAYHLLADAMQDAAREVEAAA